MNIIHMLPAIGFVPRDPASAAFGGITMTALEIASRQSATNRTKIIGLSKQKQTFSLRHKGIKLVGIKPWMMARWSKYDLHYLAPALLKTAAARPTVMHCYTDPSLLYLPAPKRVLHLQNVPAPDDKQAYLNALSHADTIICCSKFVRQSLLRLYPQFASRTQVIHNGGRQRTPSNVDFRSTLGISADTIVLLFVGAVTHAKGLHVLVNAVRNLVADGRDVALVVAGSSRLWHSADADTTVSTYETAVVAQAAGLPIHFLGNVAQDQLADVYGSADIFCCPSIWDEPFGIVNVEAMSAGLPIVASDVGGIPEIVAADFGRLVPPNDANALAQTLQPLIRNKVLRSEMSARAKRRAQAFTWDHTFTAVEAVYEELLA